MGLEIERNSAQLMVDISEFSMEDLERTLRMKNKHPEMFFSDIINELFYQN